MANDVIPRDKNRVPATGLVDTISGLTQGWSGILAGAVEAGAVAIVDGSGNQITSFGGGVQYADGTARGTATGTLGMIDDGVNIQSMTGDTSGNMFVVGNIASGITDLGNPLKVGGRYNSTKPTFSDAQRGDLQLGTRGSLAVQIVDADGTNGLAVSTNNGDGQGFANAIFTNSQTRIYNGSTFDRMRTTLPTLNTSGTGLAAAALVTQFDDVAPTTVSENSFGNLRMSANRNLYGTIRDAAGNERGVNVDASNNLQVVLNTETTKVIGTVNQGTSPWVVNTSSATGSAIPANAFMIGISDGTNLVAVRQASNGLNTTAGGLIAVNNAAQFDDVSPTSITENSFGNLRISANRNLYNTIRDAAGNERGLNISAGGNISVDTVTTLTGTTTLTPGTGATNLGKAEDAAHASGDVGVMALGVANEALTNISGTDADYTPIGTDRNGTVHVAQKASTGTLSNVASSATSVTLLAANAARIGAQITNDSSALLYIKYGTTASTTSYTVVLAGAASAPFSYFEVPAGYTGRIDGIWASATGNARVTEETP